jgi:hypothetical protein
MTRRLSTHGSCGRLALRLVRRVASSGVSLRSPGGTCARSRRGLRSRRSVRPRRPGSASDDCRARHRRAAHRRHPRARGVHDRHRRRPGDGLSPRWRGKRGSPRRGHRDCLLRQPGVDVGRDRAGVAQSHRRLHPELRCAVPADLRQQRVRQPEDHAGLAACVRRCQPREPADHDRSPSDGRHGERRRGGVDPGGRGGHLRGVRAGDVRLYRAS